MKNIFEVFLAEAISDDLPTDKKSDRMYRKYMTLSPEQRIIQDELLMTLCGWAMNTLIEKANGEHP